MSGTDLWGVYNHMCEKHAVAASPKSVSRTGAAGCCCAMRAKQRGKRRSTMSAAAGLMAKTKRRMKDNISPDELNPKSIVNRPLLRIELVAMEPPCVMELLCIVYTFLTRIFDRRMVSSFVTGCPCGVWERGTYKHLPFVCRSICRQIYFK